MMTAAATIRHRTSNLRTALSEAQLDLLLGKRRPQFVSPYLTSLEFAFVAKSDGKLSMHLNVSIAGRVAADDAVIITQTFSVNRKEYALCLAPSSRQLAT